ncbi:hypothetical protein [Microvirga tunisiensis]|uniref:Periplasmic protein-like protein n=1 Tax=Microvirga tunisiensis TaxID=2108360 RepID=A0A5N7MLH1_9HYPH|nr:hypothetical protein [Microvirga tunisiensis]MPR09664.1 hypothetical protein [Microvirga tunisiensis]MPR27865.1 hypothetical protein [Microvirga tunisiensis]
MNLTTLPRFVWIIPAVLLFLTLAFAPVAPAQAQWNDGERFDYDLSKPMVFLEAYNGGNCNGCEWIVAEGTITPDTPGKFDAFLKEKGISYRAIVTFNSPGGNLIAGVKLGEAIRARNFLTSVGKTVGLIRGGMVYTGEEDTTPATKPAGICASACSYAFLGGTTRFGIGEKIGVHQFYDKKASDTPLEKTASSIDRSADQLLSGLLLEYVIRMGVRPHLVTLASSIAPWEEMRWLIDAEMRELRVDNSETTYTPISVEPFGKAGSYVETVSESVFGTYTHRIYCRGRSKIPHVAFVVDVKRNENLGHSLDMYRKIASGIAINLKSGQVERRFNADQAGFSTIDRNELVRVTFSVAVQGASMSDFQMADEVRVEDGGKVQFTRMDDNETAWLSFKLQGDRRKLGIASRSCAE